MLSKYGIFTVHTYIAQSLGYRKSTPLTFMVTAGWGLAACPIHVGLGFLEQMVWPQNIRYKLPMIVFGSKKLLLTQAEGCRSPHKPISAATCGYVGPSLYLPVAVK